MAHPSRARALIARSVALSIGIASASGLGLYAAAPRSGGVSQLDSRTVMPPVEVSGRDWVSVLAAGACCLGDGSCLEVTDPNDCTAQGGTFTSGGSCGTTGKCTFSDDCLITTQACCTAQGGTFDPNGTCTNSGCFPSLAEEAEDAWTGVPDHLLTATAIIEAAGERAITAVIEPNLTLRIAGTSGADTIRLLISPSDPSKLRVLSPEDGSGQSFDFALASFQQIAVELGDGDDLIVFDDSNGAVGPLKQFSIDAADGMDQIITRTNGLTLAQVLTLANDIDQARNLIQYADNIRTVVGAVASGPVAGDMVSNAFDLLQRVEADFVTPAGLYVQDLKAGLIDPTAQAVLDTHDQVLAGGLPVVKQGYDRLVVPGQALQAAAELNIRDKALQLKALAEAGLVTDANSLSGCGGDLSLAGDNAHFQQTIRDLVNDVVAAVQPCLPEPEPDPNEPPPAPLPCPQVEELIYCLELEIESFGQLADVCEDAGDALEADAGAFEAQVEAQLVQPGELFEGDLELFEGDADPNYTGVADNFATFAEGFVSGLAGSLGNAGATFDARGVTDFVNPATTYEADAANQLEALAAQLQQQADQLAADAEAIIQAASALLGAGAEEDEPEASACANIVTTNVITGGPLANLLIGTSAGDLIHGGGGPDLIIGCDGNDKLYGDNGIDLILGNGGLNELHGGDDTDILIGGNHGDCLYGEDGIDLLIGRGGVDELDGGAGVDVLIGGSHNDKAWGRDGIDIIIGNDGNDTLDGGHCIDVILGGGGADTVIGGFGQVLTLGNVSLDLGDVLFGGDANDIIYGDHLSKNGTGVDVAFGGAGDDKLYLADGGDLTINSFTLKLGNVAFGGPGNDRIESKKGIDVLFGGPDSDTLLGDEGYNVTFPSSNFQMAMGDLLFGGPGNDTLEGDASDPNETQDIDLLFGYDGDDKLNAYDGGMIVFSSNFQMEFGNLCFGGDGNDIIKSRDGIDLQFGGSGNDDMTAGKGYTFTFGSSLTLDFGDLQFGQGDQDILRAGEPNQPSGGGTSGDGIDLQFGGPGDDKLYGDGGGIVVIGTSAAFYFGNLMFGENGADTLDGGYQNPDVSSSAPFGIDLMFGGPGPDTIDGRTGSHIVVLGTGFLFDVDFGDLIFGGTENDTIDSGSGLDFVFGGPGADMANTRGGIDFVFGGPGNDNLTVGDGGTITILPAPGFIPLGNIVFGGNDADTIDSDGTAVQVDLLFGNACDDTITAGTGLLDLVFGGPGKDKLYGEGDIDFLFGGKNGDTIYCGSGVVDIAFGGRGDDEIHGEDGIDLIFGGKERDTLYGDDGTIDVLFGGREPDFVSGGLGPDFIFGNKDGDELYGDDQLDLVFGNDGPDQIFGGFGLDLLFGGPERDIIYGDDGLDLLFGGVGDDELHGGNDIDLIFGDGNNDRIEGDGGFDLLFGGPSNDVVLLGANSALAFGGDHSDVLLGDSGVDLAFGGPAEDWLIGRGGFDLLFGGPGNDHLRGDDGDDFVFGGADNDDVLGGNDTDFLFGNAHNDCIDTGPGNDFGFGNRDDDSNGVRSGSDGGSTDFLFGGPGKDALYDCSGDWLIGGPGKDTKYHNDCSGCGFPPPPCGEVRGTVFANRGGIVPQAGIVVYLDTNNDGVRQSTEALVVSAYDDPATIPDETGQYRFAGLASSTAHTHHVRVETPAGYAGGGVHHLTLPDCLIATGRDFVLNDTCPNCQACNCPPGWGPVPVTLTTSDCSDGSGPCTTDSDCGCNGNCVTTTIELDCTCQPLPDCILAGDMDNFAGNTLPDDRIVMWPEFQAWVNRPNAANQIFHGGQSLPFDNWDAALNWEFGYSFLNLPLITGGTLKIHLKGGPLGANTDGLALQFAPSPPSFRWSRTLSFLDGWQGGDGVWNGGEEMTLRLDLATLPQLLGTYNLVPHINIDKRLDVYVQDDTGVDYIELCYTTTGPSPEDAEVMVLPSDLHLYAAAPEPDVPADVPATDAAARGTPPPPVLPPPPHLQPKCRYISFTPVMPAGVPEPVAYEVTVLPCQKGWVGKPRYLGGGTPDASWVADVVDQPYYQFWNMEVVHVRGCVIVPDSAYEVRTVDLNGMRSEPLPLITGIWGDLDYDGALTFNDLQVFLSRCDVAGNFEPHITFVDVAPQFVDFACGPDDQAALLEALQGQPYPPTFFPYKQSTACPLRRPCTPFCGDLDFNGVVDFADVVLFAPCLAGPQVAVGGACIDADFNGDTAVDMPDFTFLQQRFGASP